MSERTPVRPEQAEIDKAFVDQFRTNFQEARLQDGEAKAHMSPAFSQMGRAGKKIEKTFPQPAEKAATVLAKAIQERPELTNKLILALFDIVGKFDATILVHTIRALGGLLAQTRIDTDEEGVSSDADKTGLMMTAISDELAAALEQDANSRKA